MLEFRVKNNYPPGGRFFYEVPETKTFFSSSAGRQDLLDKIRQHYAVNRLRAPENLAALVDDFICRHVPDGFCDGDDDGKPRSPFRNLTFWQVEKKTRAAMVGRRLTAPDEAEKRAAICLSCSLHVRNMCTSCNGLLAVVKALVGSQVTNIASFVGACGATGCLVAAISHLAEPKVCYEGSLPTGCWLAREDGTHG